MSERIRAHQSPSSLDHEDTNGVLEANDLLLKDGVCVPSASIIKVTIATQVSFPPAHPSNRLITQLNSNWRVVDDPLQWILQRRKGNPRKRNSGWIDRSFCTTREGLVRCIREYCGEVDQNAFAELRHSPIITPTWSSRNDGEKLGRCWNVP
jgi:hypothetical protein